MPDRLIYDAYGAVIRTFHESNNSNVLIGETFEDCEPYVDMAAAERDHINMKSPLRPVAHIPVSVTDRAFREGWYNDPKAWKKWLNDPENRDFRIWEGRV